MSDDKPELLDELRTPLQIVNRLEWVLFYLKRATKTINALRVEFIAAKDAYNRAFKSHKAELKAVAGSGTVSDRDDAAQLANWDLFVAMNEAEAAYQYARDKKNDLDSELSKLQTEAGLVKKEMELSSK